jgi:aryl-alcohol dehydrogenase-like predicted oxidoreductase
VEIATSFAFDIQDQTMVGANSRPEHIRAVCEHLLRGLGIDRLDLF